MSDVKPLSAEEEAALRSETARWNPRCAFTVLHVPSATTAMSECGVARSNHDQTLDGHPFEERPSDRRTVRRLLATLAAERSARPAPAEGLDVESPGSKFLAEAATEMRRRFDHGARKFGRYSWRDDPYEDEDNLERLRRAVDHLEAARANSDDPAEWQKRAADVANQAFMFADPERYRPDAIRAALGARLEAER